MKNKLDKQKQVLFTVGVHGDEQSPVIVAKSILGKDNFLIGNPRALKKNVRYIESDLNRSFPGNPGGTIEERRAGQLVEKLERYKRVVDFHTATCATSPFVITTKITQRHMALASKTGVGKIVLMSREFGAGKSLIDFVPVGISIESGREKSAKTKEVIEKIMLQILNKEPSKKKTVIYEVFDCLKKSNKSEFLSPEIHPFKLITKGDQITNLGLKAKTDFYPVLPRSKNYPNFLCLMARKVNLLDINVKI